jgi:hypothetical protein
MGDNPSDAVTNGGFHPPYSEFTTPSSGEEMILINFIYKNNKNPT